METPCSRPIFLVRVTFCDSFKIRPSSKLLIVYSTKNWTNGQSRRFGPGSELGSYSHGYSRSSQLPARAFLVVELTALPLVASLSTASTDMAMTISAANHDGT